jgi:hypothetical protein
VQFLGQIENFKQTLQMESLIEYFKLIIFNWSSIILSIKPRGDHFRFGFYKKKSNQIDLRKKTKTEPKRNRFKPTGFSSVFLQQKSVQTDLAQFFRFCLVFFVWLGFGLVWLGFFRFGFGSVFFFGLRLIKPKPNRSVFSKF